MEQGRDDPVVAKHKNEGRKASTLLDEAAELGIGAGEEEETKRMQAFSFRSVFRNLPEHIFSVRSYEKPHHDARKAAKGSW